MGMSGMLRVCATCRWEVTKYWIVPYCSHPDLRHPITGKISQRCKDARGRDFGKTCGPTARLWEVDPIYKVEQDVLAEIGE